MRVTITFLVILTVFPMWACTTRPTSENPYATIKIYHTNDFHAHFLPDGSSRGGLAYLASLLKVIHDQEISQGTDQDQGTLVLDAGDMYKKGSMPAQLSNDLVTAELINEMPYYDARAVGNNELKVGIPNLFDWARKFEHGPLLSVNFEDKNSNSVFLPSLILQRAGLNIGIIGITPFVPLEKSIQPSVSEDNRAPYKVAQVDEALLPEIKKLRPKVDVLILLSHNTYKDNLRIASAHPEIDLVVSGHSHVLTSKQKKMGGNMVVEAGEFGHQLGVVTLVFDKTAHKVSSLESSFWPVGVDLQKPDQKMSTSIEEAYKKWAPDAFNEIGFANEDLTLINQDNPYEGSFHDFAADTFCENAHCDVALVNREMFRENIKKGHVIRETIFLAAPYEDKVARVSWPREKLITALKGSIKDDFKTSQTLLWGFSKAKVKMTVDGSHEISEIAVTLASNKNVLKVAMPLYVIKHCKDFFKEEYCPLPSPEIFGDVRRNLEEKIMATKKVDPPVLGRVQVLTEEDIPEDISY